MPYKDPEKQKTAQKAWYERNKEITYYRSKSSREKYREVIRKIKESSPCVDCNISYPYYIMHFDHLEGSDKVDGVSSMLRNSGLKNAIDEIKKCDLVCANCHAVRTWKRQHGIVL
jgi:Holliday junction resolvase RusA-like endonuclease